MISDAVDLGEIIHANIQDRGKNKYAARNKRPRFGKRTLSDAGHGLHPDYAIIVAGLVDELLKRKMPVGIHPGK